MGSEIRILLSPNFLKRSRKIPVEIKRKAIEKEIVFRLNQFDPVLKTHKLTGKLKEYWSFSVNYEYRIVFRFISDREILFVDIGTHGIYK